MNRTRHATVRIGVAAATMTALVACGAERHTPTGPARPDGREIPVKAVAGGITPPAQWPDACSLLTKKELLAVLPSAEDVETFPTSVHPYLQSRFPGATSAKFQQEAPAGGCTYKMELPTPNDPFSSTNDVGSGKFSVTLIAVGDPNVTAHYYALKKDGDERVAEFSVNGADCHTHGGKPGKWQEPGALLCSKGPVVFAVEKATFLRITFEDDGDEIERPVEERILVPVAETITADLPND